MTVKEASLAWGVDRRTILKWIMGKDAEGKGRRLVEGRDFRVVEGRGPGGRQYDILVADYPMPTGESLAPIPKHQRGIKRIDSPELPESGGSAVERRVAVARQQKAAAIAPKPEKPKAPPKKKAASEGTRAEQAERAWLGEEAPRAPRPKRQRPAPVEAVVEEAPVVEEVPMVEEAVVEEPVVEEPALDYKSMTLRQQIAAWVRSNSSNPDDQEDPVAAIGRFTAYQALMRSGAASVQALAAQGQGAVERRLREALSESPLTPQARYYAGGKAIEFLAKYAGLRDVSSTYPQGYWPVTPQTLSAIYSFGRAPSDPMLPPYEW